MIHFIKKQKSNNLISSTFVLQFKRRKKQLIIIIMKGKKLLLFLFASVIMLLSINWAIGDSKPTERERRALVDYRIDNNKYWIEKSKQGLAVLNPEVKIPQAVYKGSKIKAASVITEDSPDVPVIDVGSSTQSENSIFIDPNSNQIALNSNNSTSVGGPPSYGADYLYTFDMAETWDGSKNGAGGNNDGDPAACIGTDGRWYVNMISSGGQAVSYSDDQGQSWTKVQIVPNPGQLADKNHMWIDSKIGSPYENNLYVAWTDFGGSYDEHIVMSHSTDNGESWSTKTALSYGVNAGGHNQGVNISTGPDGEVYAIWSVYDGGSLDEDAIGFAKSLDGGETWEPSYRIIDDIRGIRATGVPQNQRVNSFPAMAVDISDGSNSGTIYVVWANIGVPGVNTGSGSDIYLIKSSDEGVTWSDPIKVNQDEIGQGKTHYFPWVAVDPSNGTVSVIFYDNRNTSPSQAEAWVANSSDAGETWEDFRVSDVAFTPSPIPGMASGYFGDYLSISALDGKVYPCWTDNRSGHAMTYVSVFETVQITSPFNLEAEVDQETGEAVLTWDFNQGSGFLNFRIYRNDVMIEETTELTFTETLVQYGYYTYKVTAYYGGTNESPAAVKATQYGTSTINSEPKEVVANVYVDETEFQELVIKNEGVLDLDFYLSPFLPPSKSITPAKGGGDEFIQKVEIGNFSNRSAGDGYHAYFENPINLKSNEVYEIKVNVSNAYSEDVCYVWVDWNSNGKFDEEEIKLQGNPNNSLFYGILDIEKGKSNGLVNMRIRLSDNENMNATDDTKYGETEDYSLLIADWLGIDPDNGIIAPGDSMTVILSFDATGLETGTYTDNIRLVTNDLNNGVYSIPVTMNVTDLQVEATASPEVICEGETTSLSAITTGGSGTFSYSWTSVPEGFTSDEQNPTVSPLENTQYTVAVNDGVVIMTASVDISVNAKPFVNLGEDEILCGESEYALNAGNEGSTYLWSTGEETQTIVATGNGPTTIWVDVTNASGCTSRDEVLITFANLPEIALGSDTTLCGSQTITLDAGNDGTEYLWSNGEESQTIEVDTAGYGYGVQSYSVMVTTEYGCEAEDEIEVEFLDCTGIGENEAKVSVSVYPNPSNGTLNINFESDKHETVDIKITSVNGQIVYSERNVAINNTLKKKINLGSVSDGIYTLFVSGDNYIVDKKIVVRK